jgi:FtsH-binding integral membrane protein
VLGVKGPDPLLKELVSLRDSISVALAVSGIGTLLTGVHAAVHRGGGFHNGVALVFVGLVAVHLWLNRQAAVRRLTTPRGLVRIGMLIALVVVILVADGTSSHIIAALLFTTAVGVHVWLYRRVIAWRLARLGWRWAWVAAGVLPVADRLAG